MINSSHTLFMCMCVYLCMHMVKKTGVSFIHMYNVKCKSQQNIGHKSYDIWHEQKWKHSNIISVFR